MSHNRSTSNRVSAAIPIARTKSRCPQRSVHDIAQCKHPPAALALPPYTSDPGIANSSGRIGSVVSCSRSRRPAITPGASVRTEHARRPMLRSRLISHQDSGARGRQPTGLCCAAGTGTWRQPWRDRMPNASARHRRHDGQAAPRSRQPSWPADRAKPHRSQL